MSEIEEISQERKEYEFQELPSVLSQIDLNYDYKIFVPMGSQKQLPFYFYIDSSSKENYFFMTVTLFVLATGTKKPVKREFVFSQLCQMLPLDHQHRNSVFIEKSISSRKRENSWGYRFVEECQREKNNSDFYVYFIRSEIDGAIKIGFSKNPEQRLNELQSIIPYKLKLLATIKGNTRKERELHRRFADDCIKNEWFRPSDKLLSYIEQIKEGKE